MTLAGHLVPKHVSDNVLANLWLARVLWIAEFLKNANTGLPRSVQVTELGRSRFFTGDAMSACPHQAGGQPITCLLAEPDTTSCFGSSSLTVFISDSLALTIQPSLAPHPDATSEITPEPLAGYGVPLKVATLSERLAPHRCQWRTALRLRGAETSVRPIFLLLDVVSVRK